MTFAMRTNAIDGDAPPPIGMTGSPLAALWAFLIFYVICLAVTWVVYTRRGGFLNDIERSRAPLAAVPAE